MVFALTPLFAQAPPPSLPPQDLDHLVSRIALYPDPLLAQVLAAATYSNDIPDAARWADQHHYLTGDALAAAISADQLPWDPSVQALLPFPSVLDMMANDHELDQASGRCFHGAATGCHGRGAAAAPAGATIRIPENEWPGSGDRWTIRRDHARQSRE